MAKSIKDAMQRRASARSLFASCGVVAFDLFQARQSGPSIVLTSKRGCDHFTVISDEACIAHVLS